MDRPCDWTRRLLLGGLTAAFLAIILHSFGALRAGRIATSQVTKNAAYLLYPSVTICPWHLQHNMVPTPSGNMTADHARLQRMEDMVQAINHTIMIGGK